MGIRLLDAQAPKPERMSAYQLRCSPGRYALVYEFFLPSGGWSLSRIGNWYGRLRTGEVTVTVEGREPT